jgi:1-acyl-sn-glycerol-3-phosphate acyltransferase
LRRLEAVPVERGAGRAPLEAYEKAREALREGRALLVFPEGTFGRSAGIRPFRLGAFQLAAEEGVAVQPIGMSGPRQVFPDGSRMLRRASVTVEVLSPLEPALRGNLRAIGQQRDTAREQVSAACGEPLLQITSVAVVRAGDGAVAADREKALGVEVESSEE